MLFSLRGGGKSMVMILIIESDVAYADQIKKKIHELENLDIKAEILHTTSLKEALFLLKKEKIDLIITNLFLQDGSEAEIITKLSEGVSNAPILVSGEKINDTLAERAIHLGAQDFFDIKKSNNYSLARLIRYSIERQHLTDTLRALTFTDELTGIYNRRGFFTLAEQQIEISQRTRHGFALYVMDIDYLKQINDTYGHQIGDEALKEIAKCIKKKLRRYDIIGRIGGDEFAAIAIDLSPPIEQNIKTKIKKEVDTHNSTPYTLSLSIGSTYYDPTNPIPFQELFQLADANLYQEKERRKNYRK